MRKMLGISGEEEEQPARRRAGESLLVFLFALAGLPGFGLVRTKKDDRYRDEYHEEVMVAQKGEESVDADGKP